MKNLLLVVTIFCLCTCFSFGEAPAAAGMVEKPYFTGLGFAIHNGDVKAPLKMELHIRGLAKHTQIDEKTESFEFPERATLHAQLLLASDSGQTMEFPVSVIDQNLFQFEADILEPAAPQKNGDPAAKAPAPKPLLPIGHLSFKLTKTVIIGEMNLKIDEVAKRFDILLYDGTSYAKLLEDSSRNDSRKK